MSNVTLDFEVLVRKYKNNNPFDLSEGEIVALDTSDIENNSVIYPETRAQTLIAGVVYRYSRAGQPVFVTYIGKAYIKATGTIAVGDYLVCRGVSGNPEDELNKGVAVAYAEDTDNASLVAVAKEAHSGDSVDLIECEILPNFNLGMANEFGHSQNTDTGTTSSSFRIGSALNGGTLYFGNDSAPSIQGTRSGGAGSDALVFTAASGFTFSGGDVTISGSLILGATTGTSPLNISSTTLVSNLNADLLDSQEGSYYRNASNINAGTLSVARGGTGLTTIESGKLIYASALDTLSSLSLGNSIEIKSGTLDTVQDIRTTASPTFAQITLAGDPTTDLEVATKQYVDNNGGGGAGIVVDTHTVTSGELSARSITLSDTPDSTSIVMVFPEGGPMQYGYAQGSPLAGTADFSTSGNTLTWSNGASLDNLSEGERVTIVYYV